jgi:ATP-binding cassette subfamily B multidrug efflux pump
LALAPDILILDEATSALDNTTERAFQAAISLFRRDTILIVIAHRLTTVEDADEIIVLDAGQVAERGTHTELLARQGEYWNLQHAAARPALELAAGNERPEGKV